MPRYVFDVEWCVEEGDDIVMDAKYIHCAVFRDIDKNETTVFSGVYDGNPISEIPKFLNNHNDLTLIGHNILNADLEVFRRLLCMDFTVGPDTLMGKKCTFIDTFTMSKRNNPDRQAEWGYDPIRKKKYSMGVHGLDAWGSRVGIKKPRVTDWSTQPITVYINRCVEDVRINELAYYMMLEEREK